MLNIITVPLINKFGSSSAKTGYLTVAVIYGCIFAACHFFCFAKTKEAVITPEKEKISIKVQLKAGFRIVRISGSGRTDFIWFYFIWKKSDVLYYFTYVEGNASYYTTYSMCIIIPSIIGAACFQPVFRKLNNKGRTASVFALLTGISMLSMFFFNVKEAPVIFYALSGITQFFFSGFNTAIYAIIPDCVEYGEWKTGLRNDGFQYAFISLGNRLEWQLEQHSCRITRKIRVCGNPDTKCSRTFHYETCIYNHSGGSLDCDCCGIILLSAE